MFAMEQHKNYVHNQNIINTSFTLTCILTLRLTFYVEKIYNSVSKKKAPNLNMNIMLLQT